MRPQSSPPTRTRRWKLSQSIRPSLQPKTGPTRSEVRYLPLRLQTLPTSSFMSVTLSVLPQERSSGRTEMDALLDTGSLAGDFIAEDVVFRYNLKPLLSDTSYTVCSGLDNRCLDSNTILLLRVKVFDESSNKYDTFDIKVHILKYRQGHYKKVQSIY